MAKRTESRKRRRTAEELFLDKLSKLTKGEQTLIPNATLKAALGWDDKKYATVHQQLRAEHLINVGQGRGGTVGLAKLPNAKALRLFVSYSHTDELDKLVLGEFLHLAHARAREKPANPPVFARRRFPIEILTH